LSIYSCLRLIRRETLETAEKGTDRFTGRSRTKPKKRRLGVERIVSGQLIYKAFPAQSPNSHFVAGIALAVAAAHAIWTSLEST
jgi:hypothetical protein